MYFIVGNEFRIYKSKQCICVPSFVGNLSPVPYLYAYVPCKRYILFNSFSNCFPATVFSHWTNVLFTCISVCHNVVNEHIKLHNKCAYS